GSLDDGEVRVLTVEATATVGMERLDAVEVLAIWVDRIVGEGEVVLVADALT
ncbi:hypothetical protein KI387_003402, partial [Taxus chinensis]